MSKKCPFLFCFGKVWEILELILFQCLLVFNSLSFFFCPHWMIYFYCFLERARGKWRERSTSWWTYVFPDWGMNSQPRYVPWPGFKPTTFQVAVTSCQDGTEVTFSKVTYFRKLPSCYCWHTYTPCGWSGGGSGTGDFVTHLQNDIWNTCVQCSWEALSVLWVLGLIHNCENIFWNMM